MTKYNPCSKEFQEEAKRLGLTGFQYTQKLIEDGKLTNPTDVERKVRDKKIKNKGCSNQREYKDLTARDKGYKDFAEYWKEHNWNSGKNSPLSENDDCPYYLGIYLGEDLATPVLEEIFGKIEERKIPNYPGYEYIVKGGYKIDVKSSRFNKRLNNWPFAIRFNNKANYFLLMAFDVDNKHIVHILLFEKNEMVRWGTGTNGYIMRKFYNRSSISISNNPKGPLYIKHFEKYEITDRLLCLKECNSKLKDKID